MYSQENNYFYEIKEFDENYSENAIISRFLHAVGFRYYWSTEGLRENDLIYKPSDTGISTRATLEHIYVLAIIINSGIKDIEVKISKLAQGLPIGAEIENLDDGSLIYAFKNRNSFPKN